MRNFNIVEIISRWSFKYLWLKNIFLKHICQPKICEWSTSRSNPNLDDSKCWCDRSCDIRYVHDHADATIIIQKTYIHANDVPIKDSVRLDGLASNVQTNWMASNNFNFFESKHFQLWKCDRWHIPATSTTFEQTGNEDLISLLPGSSRISSIMNEITGTNEWKVYYHVDKICMF